MTTTCRQWIGSHSAVEAVNVAAGVSLPGELPLLIEIRIEIQSFVHAAISAAAHNLLEDHNSFLREARQGRRTSRTEHER